jgi:hypothetical protein
VGEEGYHLKYPAVPVPEAVALGVAVIVKTPDVAEPNVPASVKVTNNVPVSAVPQLVGAEPVNIFKTPADPTSVANCVIALVLCVTEYCIAIIDIPV